MTWRLTHPLTVIVLSSVRWWCANTESSAQNFATVKRVVDAFLQMSLKTLMAVVTFVTDRVDWGRAGSCREFPSRVRMAVRGGMSRESLEFSVVYNFCID
ncbi:hypothetical protein L596_030353 [Steinernema carpocapsae]|uniref:Uncharacterized protein n=1 Tax=Steinernema carpocapsae TaxID=34508 RepID=A0A4U5LP57_STECR|nr:hypothetical protein L596_030353 [Steinernema carpocapsae]